MTRTPTLSELRKEARRVFGPGAFVLVDRYAVGAWEAEVSREGSDDGLVTRTTGTEAEARQNLMICLQALPSHSAPTPKKRKGAKR